MEEKKMGELKQEKMEQINGGGADLTHVFTGNPNICIHPDRYKTGAQREDPRWFGCSQHQFEYCCPKCKETFWVDEEV